MDAQTFGERLKAARDLRGWTQGDLCVALRDHGGFRYNDGNVRSWEKGRRWPEARAVPYIADVLGVTTDYLFGRDGAEAPTGTGASPTQRSRPQTTAPSQPQGSSASDVEKAAQALGEAVTEAAAHVPPQPPVERRRRSRRGGDTPPHA